MKLQRQVAYLAALMCISIAVAACGGGSGSSTMGPAAVPNAAAQQQAAASMPMGETTTTVQEAADNRLALPAPFAFQLTVSAGAKKCLPGARASAVISSVSSQAEKLHVSVAGLPPNTDFDLFIIQAPTAPFGLSWYQGDVEVGARGTGAADFVGRFSDETFIVAPGSTAAPAIFKSAPFPDATLNPPTGPIHEYHVGIWFNLPSDAKKAGCPGVITPFNGTHNAGIQVLNTARFPLLAGPLLHFHS